ncbi:hypothetical protein TRFO_24978 [Tritrichomonas foetus]|uniref:DOCKER Lobe A domain-containing protein n=1 Tax=Tritrichomonas foetus TaxID=1144522 RepID=A0A1J4K683_9EUKA|nr:hypothetical protein TRFO_24978 [Tritrichomonas foetus]|eukprot:OHT06927.1 hypothetical protein TRFO_24978 [Tritrichomonas foetus]
MIVVKTQKTRRATLIPSHIFQLRSMGFETYPTTDRLFSLTNEEIEKIPWISSIAQTKTSSFLRPGTIHPNQSTITDMHDEEMCTEFEKSDEKLTEKTFQAELNSVNTLKYSSNPIIDIQSHAARKKLSFPYSEKNPGIRYFLLNGITVDHKVATIDVPMYINAFVYDKSSQDMKPLSETACITWDQSGKNIMKSFTHGETENLIFPYVPVENIYLVLQVMFQDVNIPNVDGRPFAVGFIPLPTDDKCPNQLEAKWYPYVPGRPLNKYEGTANSPIQLIVEGEILPQYIPEKTIRLTAFDSLYPSPIFTIHDLTINFQRSILKKKSTIFVSATIRKIFADPKCPDPKTILAFIDPKKKQLTEYGYSSLIMYSDTLVLTDPLNFYIDPCLQENFSVLISVYRVGSKNKPKQILAASFIPTKPTEIHVVKLELKGSFLNDMKSALTRGDNTLRCSTIYPACVCPPIAVRPILREIVPEQLLLDPMFKSIAPYAIQMNLELQNLQNIDFSVLFNYFRCSDMATITPWIENFFSPCDGFSDAFANKLSMSLDAISDWPQPFFLLLYKSLCFDKMNDIPLDVKVINNLFDRIAINTNDKIRSSAGDLLLQFLMSFDKDTAHHIAFHYISQLDTFNRFYIFNFLFADVAYLQSLTLFTFEENQDEKKRPYSPYIPLLSLYYRTVTNAFIENNTEVIMAAADTLSILAATLELFVDDESAKVIAKTLFPLFAMIFTFFDSLCEKIPTITSIMPIVLFLLKSCDSTRFILYYNLLSSDNQLRFLEFLVIIVDNTLSLQFSDNTVHFHNHPLNCRYEITCRMLMFISFLGNIKITDEKIMSAIFKLLIHMLRDEKQPSESFQPIFKSIAFFVNQFYDSIFKNKTTLITQIISAVVPLTQRKLLAPRIDAIGFILWMIEKEAKVRKNCDRCNISLQYAICLEIFKDNNFVSFFNLLPKQFSDVSKLYTTLSEALGGESFAEVEVRKLLSIYEQFKNFPSIRAEIYSKIVSINKNNQNISSAFVAQWKLCALIAEVFKLRNFLIDGIPPNGSEAFPFIVNEPGVDLSKYPSDSAFLVMESEKFSEESISIAMQDALSLCQEAGLHWLIGDITQFLFDFLELHRQFSLLNKLYENVTQSFIALQKDDSPRVDFVRIFVKGKFEKVFESNELIRLIPYGSFDRFVCDTYKKFGGKIHIESGAAPIFKSNKDEACQIIPVKYNLDELLSLDAQNFTVDIVEFEKKKWNQKYVTRYTFQTDVPLPGCLPIAKVKNVKDKSIDKQDYYVEKLTQLRDQFKDTYESIKAVMPPEKMIQKWSQYISGISATPLMNMMNQIFTTNPKDKLPYFSLINEMHNGCCEETDIPDQIVKLSDEIWQYMLDAVPIIRKLSNMNTLSPKEIDDFVEYRKLLGIPIVSLDD